MNTNHSLRNLIPLLFTALLLVFTPASNADTSPQAMPRTAAELERDEIYMLLAYATVRKDWQTNETRPRRGHNIGSVLVDPAGGIVFWARNCNAITDNGSQHGEVRLIRNYLNNAATSYLKGYTVYTSLEPCAMCSGMMVLTQVTRTVYGQTDPDYGDALQRLKFDSSKLPGGYKPYPRPVISDVSESRFRKALDDAYAEYMAGGGRGITTWLRSDEAKKIYDEAYEAFMGYRVKFAENQSVLDQARVYLDDQVSDTYHPLPQ